MDSHNGSTEFKKEIAKLHDSYAGLGDKREGVDNKSNMGERGRSVSKRWVHVSYTQRECVDLNSPKRWTLQDLPTRGHPQSRLLLVAIVLPRAIVLRNITAGRVRQQPCGVKCAVKDTAVVELDSRGHNTWTAQAASCQNGVTPRSDRMVRGDEPNDSPASWQTMRTVMFSSGTALSTNDDATSRPECGWALAGRCSCVRCCGENSLSLPRRCRTSRPALANSVVVSIPPPPSATAAIVSSSTVALQPHVLSLLMSSRLARASREPHSKLWYM